MAIIAMSRELGSLGTVIGTAVAEKLGYGYIYQEITSQAARDYEVIEERLIRVVEKAPGFLERLKGDYRRYQAFVQAQVYKTAQRDNVILIGRWSTLLLREVGHAVRVRVTAPEEVRAGRVAEMMQVGREKALQVVRENDHERGERMAHLYGVDWKSPDLYDLVLNTEKVSVEAGAELIERLVRRIEYQATEESKHKLDSLAISSAIRARLKAHRPTRDVDVDIHASNRTIVLMGVVANETEKKAVERMVKGIKGVHAVESHLRVMKLPVR
jgi:cytidylate kinase